MALVSEAIYAQPKLVEALPHEALPFGLFSVAALKSDGGSHWQNGIEWEPPQCDQAGLYAYPTCVQNDGNTNPVKTYKSKPASAQAFPFVVYGSYACSPIGNWNAAEEWAQGDLIMGEERAAELAIAEGTVFNGTLAFQDAATVDITPTPGTPVTLIQGVSLLEGYIGENSHGQGAIFGNRRDVHLGISQRAFADTKPGDTQLYSWLGTPVGALSGWDGRTGPNNTAADTGESWLIATGSRPQVYRSDVTLVADRDHSLNIYTNDHRILAERTYVVRWDCFTAAVLVTTV